MPLKTVLMSISFCYKKERKSEICINFWLSFAYKLAPGLGSCLDPKKINYHMVWSRKRCLVVPIVWHSAISLELDHRLTLHSFWSKFSCQYGFKRWIKKSIQNKIYSNKNWFLSWSRFEVLRRWFRYIEKLSALTRSCFSFKSEVLVPSRHSWLAFIIWSSYLVPLHPLSDHWIQSKLILNLARLLNCLV